MISPSSRCLILSGNAGVGDQVSSLLDGLGWQIHVAHSDFRAHDIMLSGYIDVVVADIDAEGLGGLAFLLHCHHRYPGVTTYAIVQTDDAYGKRMGRDAAGCRGFFYLTQGGLCMDYECGMAAAVADMGRVLATGCP